MSLSLLSSTTCRYQLHMRKMLTDTWVSRLQNTDWCSMDTFFFNPTPLSGGSAEVDTVL